MNTTHVVTFTNFSAASERAVDRAASLAARLGKPLHLGYSGPQSGPRLAERAARLVMRSTQLERQWGIDVLNPSAEPETLRRLLEPDVLLVMDHDTAASLRMPSRGMTSRSLLDDAPCPLWLVRRDADRACETVLVPCDSLQAGQRLGLAVTRMTGARVVDMFDTRPLAARRGDARRHEWPPPVSAVSPAAAVRLSDQLSSRRNRVLLRQASTDRVLPVVHQAEHGNADLVIAACPPATWLEGLSGRSLRRRLSQSLGCDLLLCPLTWAHGTADDARRRLAVAKTDARLFNESPLSGRPR